MWSWELDPEIDCERFWKHFIFTWSVSVFAEWTFTLKPTVLRLVRLCDFYFCSPPPAIGRHYWSLWKAQRFDRIVLQCELSSWSCAVTVMWRVGTFFSSFISFKSPIKYLRESRLLGKKLLYIIRKVGEEEIQRGSSFLGYAWRIIHIQKTLQNNLNIFSNS